jgi:nicotinamide mononucleotide transporter
MELVIEIFGVVIGLVYIYFQMKQSTWMWVVCIASGLVFAGIFFGKGLYANMLLQLYFVAAGGYALWAWKYRRGVVHETGIAYRRLNLVTGLCAIGCVFVFCSMIIVGLGYVDIYFGENTGMTGLASTTELKRIGDAFTTAASIVATALLAFRVLEQWLFWIVSDTVAIILFVNAGLYPTAILYGCFIVLAVIGFSMWLKKGRRLYDGI